MHKGGVNCIPDIITLGKSIGNGFPLGAVITTKKILNIFKKNLNNQEYFNTFGGNPVACCIGYNLINIIKNENLLNNATNIGNYLLNKFKKLKIKYNNYKLNNKYKICNIRGKRLFIGTEIIKKINNRKWFNGLMK